MRRQETVCLRKPLSLFLCAVPEKNISGEQTGFSKYTGKWAWCWYGRSVISDTDSLRSVHLYTAWIQIRISMSTMQYWSKSSKCTKTEFVPIFGYWCCSQSMAWHLRRSVQRHLFCSCICGQSQSAMRPKCPCDS